MRIHLSPDDLDPGLPTPPRLAMGAWPDGLSWSSDADGFPVCELPASCEDISTPFGFEGRITFRWHSESLRIACQPGRLHLVLQPRSNSIVRIDALANDLQCVEGAGYGALGVVTPLLKVEPSCRIEALTLDLGGRTAELDLGATLLVQPSSWLVVRNGRIELRTARGELPPALVADGQLEPCPPLPSTANLLLADGVVDGQEVGQGYSNVFAAVGFGSSGLRGTLCQHLTLLPYATFGIPDQCVTDVVRGRSNSVMQLWPGNRVRTVQSEHATTPMILRSRYVAPDGDDSSSTGADLGPAAHADIVEALTIELEPGSVLQSLRVDRCTATTRPGIPSYLCLADGGQASRLEFSAPKIDANEEAAAHPHVELRAGERSVLSDVTGSLRLSAAKKSIVLGGPNGFEVCSVGREQDRAPALDGARLEGFTLPLAGVDSPFIIGALQSAAIVNLNPPALWRADASLLRRTRDAAVAIARPRSRTERDLRRSTSLHLLGDLVTSKSSLGSTRATYRYLALADRQETAPSGFERLLLGVLRVVGFGWRPGRAGAVWLVTSVVVAFLAGRDHGVSFTTTGVSNAGALLVRTLLSPLGLIAGAGSPNLLANEIQSDLWLTLARLAIAIPFGSLLLAMSRLARV